MKGFNIGRTESFPLVEPAPDSSMISSSASLPNQPSSIKSPLGIMKRAARMASTKQRNSRRRWGNLVEAARTVKHTFGRSSSQDSTESESSASRNNTKCSTSFESHSGAEYSGSIDHTSTSPSVQNIQEGLTRLSVLRSRLTSLSHLPHKLRMPSFDESRNNAKARRHMYGGKIHTGSLKPFVKRTTSPMFASQRRDSKTPTLQEESFHNQATSKQNLPAEHSLTPIPSQPSSIARSSPEVTPPPSPRPGASSAVLTLTAPTDLATRSTSTCTTPGAPSMLSSPESVTMTESCSSEPLVSRRGSSPKPSNGSAMMSKLPGVQQIGRGPPSGWL